MQEIMLRNIIEDEINILELKINNRILKCKIVLPDNVGTEGLMVAAAFILTINKIKYKDIISLKNKIFAVGMN